MSLRPGKTQLITIAHVEVGPGDSAAGVGRRLSLLVFKIDFHFTSAVLTLSVAPLTVLVVAAISIDLADRGLQVMQVGFDLPIHGVFGAVFTPAVLPALALMNEFPSRYHMFPFDAVGAQLAFTNLIAAGRQIRDALFALLVYAAITIKSTGRVAIDFHRCRFCLVKIGDFMHLGRGGKGKGKYGGGASRPKILCSISVCSIWKSAGYLIASRQTNRTRAAPAGGNQGEALWNITVSYRSPRAARCRRSERER